MINRVKLLGFAVSGNLDTHVLTATPYSTNDQVSQYEEVILEVLAEGFDEARSIKLNFTLPDDSTVEDIHMKPIGNNKFQVRLNDVIGNKLTVGTTQTVNVEIIVYTRSGYARTETPVSYQLYKTSLDTTYHPTDMDVAFIAINQLISDTSGSDGSVSEIKDKIDRIVDGSTVVGRANADADGNVIKDTYLAKDELPTKLSQFTNDGDGNKPFITSAALANYATKSELPSLAGYATEDFVNTTVSAGNNSTLSTAKAYTDNEVGTLHSQLDNYPTKIEFNEYKTEHTNQYNTLNDKVNHFLDVDDTTKDQLSEIIDLINKTGGTADLIAEVNKKADKDSVYTKEQTNTEIINAVESAYGTVLEIGINNGYIASGNELRFDYNGTFKNNTRYFLSLHAALITRTGDLPDDLKVYITDKNANKIGITCISQPDITKTATTKNLNQIERQDPLNGFYWYAMGIYRDTSDGKTFYIDTINCEEYSVLTGEELTSKLAYATIKPGQYVFATTDSGAIRKGHTYRINGDITSGTLEVHEEDVSGVFGGEAVQIKYGESGTLTAAQLLKLQQNTDNYIITTDDNQHYEIFRLSTEASKSGYRTYSCIEYENSKPIIRTITITENVRAWVMKSTEVGSGSSDVKVDTTVISGSKNAVSGGAVYTAIDNATTTLNSTINTKISAITDSLSTVATTGSYNDLKNKPVIPSLLGYATEEYVNEKARTVENKIPSIAGLASEVYVTTKINETEAKIPSVDNLASRDELNNAIEGVNAKIPSLAGYATQSYVDSKVSSVYRYKGSVKTRANLPENPEAGDVYNIESSGMNVAWTGSSWDDLGGTIDVSTKQDKLVSGTNIKTINNTSILSEGNIDLVTPNDLTAYAKTTSIPTKISQLTNDSGYFGSAHWTVSSGTDWNDDNSKSRYLTFTPIQSYSDIVFAYNLKDEGNTTILINEGIGELGTDTEPWGYITLQSPTGIRYKDSTGIKSFDLSRPYITTTNLPSYLTGYATESWVNDKNYLTQTVADGLYKSKDSADSAGINDTTISTTTTYSSRKIEDTFLQAPDNILQIKGASPVVRIINDGLNDSTELTGDKITFYDNTDNRTVSIEPVYAADTKDGYISVNGYKLARDVDLAKKLDKTGGNVDSLTINSKAVATQEWVEGKSYLTSTSLNGYATEEWVNGKNYLTMASLDGYAKTFEIPTKVSQLTDASSYATTEYVDNKVSSVYRYRNSVANKDALPTTGNVIGDVYNLEDTGMNVAWNGTSWDELGSTVDLTNYALKSEIPTKVSQLANDKNYLTEHQSLDSKQDKLVSGTNIKTINGVDILGAGNITIDIPANTEIDDTTVSTTKTYSSNKIDSTYAKKSDIPAKVSEFKNDAGYLTAVPDTYATKAYVDEKATAGGTSVKFVMWED